MISQVDSRVMLPPMLREQQFEISDPLEEACDSITPPWKIKKIVWYYFNTFIRCDHIQQFVHATHQLALSHHTTGLLSMPHHWTVLSTLFHTLKLINMPIFSYCLCDWQVHRPTASPDSHTQTAVASSGLNLMIFCQYGKQFHNPHNTLEKCTVTSFMMISISYCHIACHGCSDLACSGHTAYPAYTAYPDLWYCRRNVKKMETSGRDAYLAFSSVAIEFFFSKAVCRPTSRPWGKLHLFIC